MAFTVQLKDSQFNAIIAQLEAMNTSLSLIVIELQRHQTLGISYSNPKEK